MSSSLINSRDKCVLAEYIGVLRDSEDRFVGGGIYSFLLKFTCWFRLDSDNSVLEAPVLVCKVGI